MKTYKNRNRILGAVILLTILLSLLFPTSTVFADDPTPPDEPAEVVDAPLEEDAPPEEENVLEVETPEGEQPDEEELANEEPVSEEVETEAPITDDVAPEASEEPAAEQAVVEESVGEDSTPEGEADADAEPVLAMLPDGTDVVVLDEEGAVVPLATQEAAEAITSSDPMWCPDGVAPIANTGGCTGSYASMSALLSYLYVNQPNQDGTIWIENTYDSSAAEPVGTNFVTINGNSYATWGDYSLTIQGGWDGTASGTVSGTSLFAGDRLRIINWRNDVTIQDIVFDGASGGPGLEIVIDTASTSTYNVLLDNVEVKNNTDSRGAYIDNDESTGSVTVNNSTFTNNGSTGLEIYAMGNVTLQDISSSGNGDIGALIYNIASSAAATVQVLGTNVFSGNLGDGVLIRSNGDVTLNNITANNNTDAGAVIQNNLGTTNANVTITGTNNFNGNTNQGLFVRSNGVITLSNITANSNNNVGALLINNYAGAVGDVTIDGVNSFSGNSAGGLFINSTGVVDLDNIIANGNGDASGFYPGVFITSLGNIFLNNITANANGNDGLYVISEGLITLVEVVASQNIDDGAYLNNDQGASTSNIEVVKSTFNNNGDGGLIVASDGNVTLINVTAQNNGGDGAFFIFPSLGTHTATICGGVFSGHSGAGNYNVQVNNGDVRLTNLTPNNWNPGTGWGADPCNYLDTDGDQVPDQWDTDDDNDGVLDAADLCPGTPAGEPVNANGCSASQLDSDGDGVSDAADLCPGTPAGEPVNANGCSASQLDSDGDGVSDAADLCPGTPAGEPVNANGCSATQLDSDGDGVSDAAALCPGTPAGEPVDANGCSASQLDSDGDGVSNTADRCPGTPAGKPVDANGCSAGQLRALGDVGDDQRTSTVSSISFIPLTGGHPYALSCDTPMTKLQMLNGDFVIFTDLCGYTAMLEAIPEDGLPGELPDGTEYISALNVALLHEGDSVDPLPESTSMSVAFKVPAGKQAESFAILRWDGGGWVEENVSLENGYVMATTSHTGTFALVVK